MLTWPGVDPPGSTVQGQRKRRTTHQPLSSLSSLFSLLSLPLRSFAFWSENSCVTDGTDILILIFDFWFFVFKQNFLVTAGADSDIDTDTSKRRAAQRKTQTYCRRVEGNLSSTSTCSSACCLFHRSLARSLLFSSLLLLDT